MAGAPIKVAIVGSGPSAFYAAARLLSNKAVDTQQVHMYERLPTPHGLVRYGVAPDHPEVKNVENKFAQVAQDARFRFFGNVNVVGDSPSAPSSSSASTSGGASSLPGASSSSSPAYRYPHALRLRAADLIPHYTHVLLAYGCSLSRPLGIPGSAPGDLANVHAALDFVNWYNGHPAAHDEAFLRSHPWRRVSFGVGTDRNTSSGLRHATVIGAGNVALDVARILLRASSTLHPLFHADSSIKARAALRETDIPEPVLAELAGCRIEQVDIVARRGPAQVAFTSKELREMMELQGVSFRQPPPQHYALAHAQVRAMEAEAKGLATPDPPHEGHAASSAPNESHRQALSSESRVRKRLLGIMEKGSSATEAAVRWGLDFFKSPTALEGRPGESVGGTPPPVARVQWDEMEFQRLPSEADRDQPWAAASAQATGQRVRSTGRHATTPTDLVISSVGYRAEPLEALTSQPEGTAKDSSFHIPWDAQRGMVRNRGGQVVNAAGVTVSNRGEDGRSLRLFALLRGRQQG